MLVSTCSVDLAVSLRTYVEGFHTEQADNTPVLDTSLGNHPDSREPVEFERVGLLLRSLVL